MKKGKVIKGLHTHRFKNNPTEEVFAKAWLAANDKGYEMLDHLLDPNSSKYPSKAAERDYVVAATVIQWLGSPVGQCFLRDLGYVKT